MVERSRWEAACGLGEDEREPEGVGWARRKQARLKQQQHQACLRCACVDARARA